MVAHLSMKDTMPSPGPAMATEVRQSRCDAYRINVTETLFSRQSPGLWPRGGSSPNHEDDFFCEVECEIEPVLPLVLPGAFLLNIICDISSFSPSILNDPEGCNKHRNTPPHSYTHTHTVLSALEACSRDLPDSRCSQKELEPWILG